MKKLRPSTEEKEQLLLRITDKLNLHTKGTIESFNIDDLKEEFTKIPKEINKPSLYIDAEAYLKMLELVNQSSTECAWHGLVKRNLKENKYYIYDVLVYPQINSATSTTTDEKAFAQWQTNLILDPNFPIEDLRMHGHSHVNMNVFSSGVDDKYQEDLLTKVDDGDYYIFLIMNKKMEICIFIYDFIQQIMFDKNDIKYEIVGKNNNIKTWAKTQLAANTRTAPIQTSKSKHMSYWDERWDDENYTILGTKTSPIFKGRK